MVFLIPFLGVVLGAMAGFSLGAMVQAGYGDLYIDMRYPLLMLGAVIGYFIGRMIAGKPSDNQDKGAK